MQPQHLDPAPDPFETRRTPILHWVAAAFVVGAAIGIAGVYGMGGFEGNAPEAGKCRDAPEKAARLAPFVKGNVAAFRPTRKAQQWGDQPPSAAGSVYPPAQAPPRAAQEGQDVVPRRPGRALGALRPGPR